jgi:hypothetical protein
MHKPRCPRHSVVASASVADSDRADLLVGDSGAECEILDALHRDGVTLQMQADAASQAVAIPRSRRETVPTPSCRGGISPA